MIFLYRVNQSPVIINYKDLNFIKSFSIAIADIGNINETKEIIQCLKYCSELEDDEYVIISNKSINPSFYFENDLINKYSNKNSIIVLESKYAIDGVIQEEGMYWLRTPPSDLETIFINSSLCKKIFERNVINNRVSYPGSLLIWGITLSKPPSLYYFENVMTSNVNSKHNVFGIKPRYWFINKPIPSLFIFLFLINTIYMLLPVPIYLNYFLWFMFGIISGRLNTIL